MALVDVDTIVGSADFETFVAMTLVRTDGIDAAAVVADVQSSRALIYVHAGVSRLRQREARIANTLEASL